MGTLHFTSVLDVWGHMSRHKDIAGNLSQVNWDFPGFRTSSGEGGIQGAHWYPAPFPPALPGTLFDILGTESCVFLDPFCGSGIAPLEAWLRGARVHGIDNNRIALEICDAKVDLVQYATFELGQKLCEQYEKYRAGEISAWRRLKVADICQSAGFHADARMWFVPGVLAELAVIRSWLDSGVGLVKAWRGGAR